MDQYLELVTRIFDSNNFIPEQAEHDSAGQTECIPIVDETSDGKTAEKCRLRWDSICPILRMEEL